jgi:exodeoxyribonuclease-3
MTDSQSVLRIATWNVNSLRQRLDGLARLSAETAPDVICLQETKVENDLFPAEEIAGIGYPHQVVHGQKSYNGVAIISRLPFEEENRAVWCEKDDCRHLAVRLGPRLELHNFYVPSGGPKPDPESNPRFAHKLGFLEEMSDWAERREVRESEVLIVGDLNVAPLENDVWNHKRLLRNVGHTPGESERLLRILDRGGLTDIARHFVPPEEPLFTWWGYRFPQSFERNYGWRLDHAFASAPLMTRVRAMRIVQETRGWERPSDHVPVLVTLD